MLLVLLGILVVLLIVLPLIGLALWAIISVGIVGIIIGGLARLILPGQQNVGVFATVLIGWIGSIIGGFLGYHVIGTGRFLTVLLEIGVAAVLIAAYSGTSQRRLGGNASNQTVRW